MTEPTLPEPRIDLQLPRLDLPALEITRMVERLERPSFDAFCVTSNELPEAVVRWLGPGFRFRLEEEFRIVERSVCINIPAGFIFDAASVPRFFWAGISPTELGIVAPLVHDWLYRTGGQYGALSRSQADQIFLDHMKAEGVSAWRRWAAYAAVRIGGGGSWRDDASQTSPPALAVR